MPGVCAVMISTKIAAQSRPDEEVAEAERLRAPRVRGK
jgi:hypothetical protein